MSKQELTLTAPPAAGCCAPISSAALDAEQAAAGAAAFKALADPVRLRLLSIIASAGGEICVCDITPQFDVSGPTISHHLKVLREAGLVDCERRGTWVYYWPIPERIQWIAGLLATPINPG
ncbi:metalloregulator ArsR/SmtB family transcription factor [Kribbella yunnanensis]|uniref:Metalloregulator ArsR/SmtB family transcription factor n=1 Tax=Kribbella yunnanensis TaxID=190194 RepID=A0ABN2H0W7_9ACTN